MKTIQVLDRPEEVAALFGDGVKLILADGQEITIRAEGELIKMDGKFTFLMLDVRGSSETVQQAMKQAAEIISAQLDGGEPIAVNGHPTAAALPASDTVTEPPPRLTPPAVGRGKGKRRRSPYGGPALRCSKCGRESKSPQGHSRHQNNCRGQGGAVAGDFWCPVKNCAHNFKTESARRAHAREAHGMEL